LANNPDDIRNSLLLDLVKSRYDDEVQRIRDLDSKANNMTGYVSIVISLFIGAGTFGVLGGLPSFTYYIIPYLIGLLLLTVSFLFALSAIAIRRYKFVPRPETLIRNYLNKSPRIITLTMLANLSDAVTQISEMNEVKALKIIFSWAFLLAGIGSIIIFVFMLALNETIM
jgi:hypothetical protein